MPLMDWTQHGGMKVQQIFLVDLSFTLETATKGYRVIVNGWHKIRQSTCKRIWFFFSSRHVHSKKVRVGTDIQAVLCNSSSYLLIMNDCHVALFGFSDPRALLQELDKIYCFEVWRNWTTPERSKPPPKTVLLFSSQGRFPHGWHFND